MSTREGSRPATVLDHHHHNGDPYWDGDQTLYELELVDGDEHDSLLFVVTRGTAFISAQKVGRHVEHMGSTLATLRSVARVPASGRRPQVRLAIEPGRDEF